MTTTKIPLSDILRSEKYAIRITSAAQVEKLVPHYPGMADLEMFFATDPRHREFVGPTFGTGGTGFYFCHPQGKEIIDFKDVEFDIQPL